MKYVTTGKFCELTGYTKKATEGKIYRGQWLEGVVWLRAPDGRTLMNLEGYEKWVQSNVKKRCGLKRLEA